VDLCDDSQDEAPTQVSWAGTTAEDEKKMKKKAGVCAPMSGFSKAHLLATLPADWDSETMQPHNTAKVDGTEGKRSIFRVMIPGMSVSMPSFPASAPALSVAHHVACRMDSSTGTGDDQLFEIIYDFPPRKLSAVIADGTQDPYHTCETAGLDKQKLRVQLVDSDD
jgi:hypothetical protein